MTRVSIFSFILIIASVFHLVAQTIVDKENENYSALQFISDSTSNGMRWRLVGPFRGGRALAASGIPGNSTTFYFGAVDGGVWKSTNAGLTWKPVSDGQTNPSIGALAIAPSSEKIIYIGTGECDMRSDITNGNGIYKSTDGGEHWIHTGLEDSRHIGKILIDHKNSDLVLVAALGHAYGPNEERGVFRTTNGGKSWQKVLYKNNQTGAIDLAWDDQNPKVVYASMWQAKRTAWSQYPPDEGPESGLYKSTDEGSSWTEIRGKGFPASQLGRVGVAVVEGSNGKNVYALIEAKGKESGLYYSGDGGSNWKLMSNNSNIITRMWYFGRVFIDPQNPKTIYIPNRSILRSTDSGKTFTVIKGEPGGDDYHFLWIDPQNNKRMIVASDQGTSISLDYGNTWSSWYNQSTAQFYHVKTDNQFPYRIYGAQQDAGTVSITSRSDYGIITFRNWYSIGAGESGYIAPDPVNPNIVYGGSTYGGLFRYDHVTGQSQTIAPWLLSEFSQAMPKRNYRFTWTSPIGFDPHNYNALYFGSQFLLQTTNGGLNWTKVSPDLTYGNVDTENDSLKSVILNRGWGVIYSFAFSPVQKGLIWVGTDDGIIQLTMDYGKHWQNVTPDSLAPWSKVSIIEASPFDSKVAYAAVDRHRLDDFEPYIYRTKDYGKHWTIIDQGISNLSFVRTIRSDPEQKGLLYAGTETGVYVSFNDGDNWHHLQLNLPTVSVRDLAIHENDLIAATHGRSFWVLDDVTSLRKIAKILNSSNAFLFKPETAIRIRKSENRDTPLPPEIPQGSNPPSGAIINYYLKSVPSKPVTLDIFDNKGNLVRHYSSNDKPKPFNGQPYYMTKWLPQFEPLTNHPGINRFTWDLQYPQSEGLVERPQGPFVLPGEYKITLTAGNVVMSQILNLKMDPRVKVAKNALFEQLKLAIVIWNAASDKNKLKVSIDSVKNQIAKLNEEQGKANAILSLNNELENKIDSLDKSISNSTFSSLQRAVLSADREPAKQMYSAYKILNNKLIDAMKQWNELKLTNLKKLNTELREKSLPIIQVPSIISNHLSFGD